MKKHYYVPATVAATLILDLATKHIADTRIAPYEPLEVFPFFNLVNVENTGAAFSMLSGIGNGFFIGVALIAMTFIIYLLARTQEHPLSLALILGGAAGNLVDRIYLGYVRDFLDFHLAGWHWPAFNVADSALTIGLFLLLWHSIRHSKANQID